MLKKINPNSLQQCHKAHISWKRSLWSLKTVGLTSLTNFAINLLTSLILKSLIKNIVLINLSIYYTWKNIKFSYSNNKFKISAPTWNDKFDLPDGSYSASDTQLCFEYIIKKTRDCNKKSSHKNLHQQNQKSRCIRDQDRLLIRVITKRNNEIAR